MKPQLDICLEQLNSAYQALEIQAINLPSTFNYQSKSFETTDLRKAFLEMIGLISAVNQRVDVDPLMIAIHQPNIINVGVAITQLMTNLTANPQPYLESLLSNIWSLKSSLVWLVPLHSGEYYENLIKNTDVSSKLAVINELEGKVFETYDNLIKSTNETIQSRENIESLLQVVKGYEREVANAKINVETSSSTVAISEKSIVTLLNQFEENVKRQEVLQSEINELSQEASLVLEGTSKAGLAASFGLRRKALENSQTFWIKAFVGGILGITLGTLLTTTGVLKFAPLINDKGAIDAWGVIARVLVTGPAIWFTWFAARQYGQTLRLIEDYAFKEASALAFVGYKREMGEDQDMIKLLRESAIQNFGSSPTRLFSGSEPSSPLHDLIDKAIEDKGVFDRVIEMLKALKPNK